MLVLTGEMGWELYHKMEDSDRLYAALAESGATDFGTYALNSLRLEKGFRMWGAEMTMDSNPYEAGLEMFLRPRKSADFVGKAALERIRREGTSRRLVQLRVENGESDPEGDETVWCAGKVRSVLPGICVGVMTVCLQAVGHVTSGSYGYETGCGIAFAYVPHYLAYDGCEVTVDLLGERRPAVVTIKPPVVARHA
ncbi:DMGDH [Cordylochernes scorpioides]|uniref:DMGDH n=1 Tax=Cordylochernes scorpioides TaxID=51811 RepID=A0ABY6KU58_9ARAC|nr:DMGDH [Cordylochernes scorpioides]